VNTVSRALRGDTKLSEQTRKKIQQTAKEKGYIRNNLASSLRSGASHIIAVIVNDIRNQHFTSMISEIELFLRQAGYDMMILCTQLEEQGRQIGTQMVHVAISQSVDGILYFLTATINPWWLFSNKAACLYWWTVGFPASTLI
ncbi:MAG: LacI family DNA-binding transcriptional regulator, partial [[Clostridium] leptum]